MTETITVVDLARFLDKVQSARFFGKVEISFESGGIVCIKTMETIKPHNLKNFIN